MKCVKCGAEIPEGSMFCPECGAKLESKKNPMIWIAAVIIALSVIGACVIISNNNKEKAELAALIEKARQDSIAAANKAVAVESSEVSVSVKTEQQVEPTTVEQNNSNETREAAKTQQTASTTDAVQANTSSSDNGTIRLSYGTYSGAIKGGYPHGQGRLTYSTTRQINRNDIKGRTADAGDYVIGEFFNGFVVYGKHYNAAGELLGSLNFGVGSESSYDSK